METAAAIVNSIFVLGGLHPGHTYSGLFMRDFNQEILLARVAKPEGDPQPGWLLPVLVSAHQLTEETKRRIARRQKGRQITSFTLDGMEFLGRFVQFDDGEPADQRSAAPSFPVTAFVIECERVVKRA